MNDGNEDWLKDFEKTHGRKPSFEEFSKLENLKVDEKSEKFNQTTKVMILVGSAVAGLVFVLLLVFFSLGMLGGQAKKDKAPTTPTVAPLVLKNSYDPKITTYLAAWIGDKSGRYNVSYFNNSEGKLTYLLQNVKTNQLSQFVENGQAMDYQVPTSNVSAGGDYSGVSWKTKETLNGAELAKKYASSAMDFKQAIVSAKAQLPQGYATMNIGAIAKGDLSSVLGIWQNAKGETLTFSKSGKDYQISEVSQGLSHSGIAKVGKSDWADYVGLSDNNYNSEKASEYPYIDIVEPQNKNGILVAGADSPVPLNWYFVPKGQSAAQLMQYTADGSDKNKDRIYYTSHAQQKMDDETSAEITKNYAYYKILDDKQYNLITEMATWLGNSQGMYDIQYFTKSDGSQVYTFVNGGTNGTQIYQNGTANANASAGQSLKDEQNSAQFIVKNNKVEFQTPTFPYGVSGDWYEIAWQSQGTMSVKDMETKYSSQASQVAKQIVSVKAGNPYATGNPNAKRTKVPEQGGSDAISAGMNLEQIKENNFTSVQGTWKDADGDKIIVTDSEIDFYIASTGIQSTFVKFSDIIPPKQVVASPAGGKAQFTGDNHKNSTGEGYSIYQATLQNGNVVFAGSQVIFMPAGSNRYGKDILSDSREAEAPVGTENENNTIFYKE